MKRMALGLMFLLMAGVSVQADDVRKKTERDSWWGWPQFDNARVKTEWDTWSKDVPERPKDLSMKGVSRFDSTTTESGVSGQELRLRNIERKLDRILKELEGLKGR